MTLATKILNGERGKRVSDNIKERKFIHNAFKEFNEELKCWQVVDIDEDGDKSVSITCKTEKGLLSNWIKFCRVWGVEVSDIKTKY